MEENSFQNSPSKQTPAVEKLHPATNWKKLTLWVILVGVFLLLILLTGFYFYWQYFTNDDLINLAPVDSVLYVTARDSIWPIGQKTEISDLPFSNFFQVINEGEVFASVDFNNFLVNSGQAAFILVLNKDLNLDPVFIFKIKNFESINSTLASLPNYVLLDGNILVVAGSKEALDKIKEVNQGSVFSLSTQINQKRLGRDLMSLYLNSNNLKSYLNSRENLVDTIFTHLINQDIYLILGRKNDQWNFKLAIDFFEQSQMTEPLISYLPKDFSIFISGVNLSEIFNAWAGIDKDFFGFFKQIADSSKSIYNFDLEKNMASLLNQPSDLIIFDQSSETVLGFNYILIFPHTTEEQSSNFEKLIKIILAQKLPQEAARLLPDGSNVVELLAAEDTWQWQEEKLENSIAIKYLPESDLNLEISYLIQDGKMIVSSSISLLKDFIFTKDIDLRELNTQCNGSSLNNNLILNSSNLSSFFSGYLPTGTILIKVGTDELNGCLNSY